MSETPRLEDLRVVTGYVSEWVEDQTRPATADEVRAAVVPLLDLEAAAKNLLGEALREPLRHNWTDEGIDIIEARMARRAVYAALGLGEPNGRKTQ